MASGSRDVVVGLDNGGTAVNATVFDRAGNFLVDRLVETPSRVTEGPDKAIEALATSLDLVLSMTSTPRQAVQRIGLDTPGPASADGVICSLGAVNFKHAGWRGFDIRGVLEDRLGLPVTYNNDANAAALYAHNLHFGASAAQRSSVSLIVGTGLGGGVIESGRVVRGAAGMAGELGHIQIPTEGLLEPDQPVPLCNCGLPGDTESFASLTGITKNLLPYWLTRYPDHELAGLPLLEAAKQVRGLASAGDPMSLEVFRQQAMALARAFTIAANFTDPHAYFVGGGVVEAAPAFREWFVSTVRTNTALRTEQTAVAEFAVVPDLDMAGARGSALAAAAELGWLPGGPAPSVTSVPD